MWTTTQRPIHLIYFCEPHDCYVVYASNVSHVSYISHDFVGFLNSLSFLGFPYFWRSSLVWANYVSSWLQCFLWILNRQDGFQETWQEADMDDQPDDNPVDKGCVVVDTVGYMRCCLRVSRCKSGNSNSGRMESTSSQACLWEWHKKSLTRRIVSSEWTRH